MKVHEWACGQRQKVGRLESFQPWLSGRGVSPSLVLQFSVPLAHSVFSLYKPLGCLIRNPSHPLCVLAASYPTFLTITHPAASYTTFHPTPHPCPQAADAWSSINPNVYKFHSAGPDHANTSAGIQTSGLYPTGSALSSLAQSNYNTRFSQVRIGEEYRTRSQSVQQTISQSPSSNPTPTLHSRPSFQDGTTPMYSCPTNFAAPQPLSYTQYSFAGESPAVALPRSFDTYSQQRQFPSRNSLPIDPDPGLSFHTRTDLMWAPPTAHVPYANDRLSQLHNPISDQRYRRLVNPSGSAAFLRRCPLPLRRPVDRSTGVSARNSNGIAIYQGNGLPSRSGHDTRVACAWKGGSCHTMLQPNRTEINAHLRADHACNVPGLQLVRCCWGDCSGELQMQNLARHIASCHLQAKHQCSFCGRMLCREDALVSHERKCGKRGQGVAHTTFAPQ